MVIVGVGNADFSSTQFLDDSENRRKPGMAQFAEFNKNSKHSVQLTSYTLLEFLTSWLDSFKAMVWLHCQPFSKVIVSSLSQRMQKLTCCWISGITKRLFSLEEDEMILPVALGNWNGCFV